jgi:hypothetical protein
MGSKDTAQQTREKVTQRPIPQLYLYKESKIKLVVLLRTLTLPLLVIAISKQGRLVSSKAVDHQ